MRLWKVCGYQRRVFGANESSTRPGGDDLCILRRWRLEDAFEVSGLIEAKGSAMRSSRPALRDRPGYVGCEDSGSLAPATRRRF